MTQPREFSARVVSERSPPEAQLYSEFLSCGEPYRSMLRANPWLAPPDMRKPFEYDADRYWNTTVGRKHPYWRDTVLPRLTKDIRVMRQDLSQWGYCLVEDGMSASQHHTLRTRLLEQADGERAAGLAQLTPSGQYVHTLVNKGQCFERCIEQDPGAVQAGPLIEQIMNETLGPGWICHSFLANGADPGRYPQGLHMDQGPLSPLMTVEAPALMNTMYIFDDVNEHNGGTLVIPGSHRVMMDAGSGGQIGELPPAINVEAPGGTIMLFDGRLLHGTGANRTGKRRFVATMSNVKSWMRTQENWVISVRPEVLRRASPKLLHRMGFQVLVYGSTVEGFGITARGAEGEVWGNILPFREALDDGTYERVGELRPDSAPEELTKPYTRKNVVAAIRASDD